MSTVREKLRDVCQNRQRIAACVVGLVVFAVTCPESMGSTDVEAAAPPLNIVLLYADDWRHDTLGVAGNPIVQTPNLDRLAAEGIRFSHNYVTTSICGVSRATLYTGQWMSRHGNRAFAKFETPWNETYPGLLREQGYHVGFVGKWHNGPFPQAAFDFGHAYQGRHWIKQSDGSEIHVTAKNQVDALTFLRDRPKEKPFCLTVSFFATHAEDANAEQFLPHPDHRAPYQDIAIPVPVNATNESWERLPPFFNEDNEGRRRWRWRFDTPEKYQRMMKNYYGLVTGVDAACGEIINELQQQGLDKNTLVIFTTDNGYFHGEHGLADKWYPYQESIRVPLIMRDPRLPVEQRNTVNDQITLNVDLAPTIVRAAGMMLPPRMQGRDLFALYSGSGDSGAVDWRDDFYYEHDRIGTVIPPSQAVVSKHWKYILWPEANYEQLFNLALDPLEENDLARKDQYLDELVKLRNRFSDLRAAAE